MPTKIEILQDRGRKRFVEVDEDADVAHATVRAATDGVNDARSVSGKASAAERAYLALPNPMVADRGQGPNGNQPGTKSQTTADALASRTAEAQQAFLRKQEILGRRSEDWTHKRRTSHGLETYVNFVARNGGSLPDAEVNPPRGATIESATEQVETERAGVAEILRSILPVELIKTMHRRDTAEGLSFQLAVTEDGRVHVRPPQLGAGGHDAAALLKFYFADVVSADLDRQAEELVAGRLQLTVEQRRERLLAARAELLHAEMVLGELIWRRHAETGTGLDFPPGLDPRSILGVVGPVPPAP